MKNTSETPIKKTLENDTSVKNGIENEQQKPFIFSSTNKSNDIALNIIKVSKYIFEKIALDIEDSDLLCKSLEQIKIEINHKDFRDFNLSLYDEHFNYYNDLQKYFASIFSYNDILLYFDSCVLEGIKKSYISLYYFSILLELLIELLEKNPSAHEDKIIKFDISVICEFFKGKNRRLCLSNTFFYCCINELIKKYQMKIPERNEFRNKIFEIESKKAKNTLDSSKKNLSKYIQACLNKYLSIKNAELFRLQYSIKTEKDEIDYNNKKKNFDTLKMLAKEIINLPNNYEEAKKICNDKKITSYLTDFAEYIAKIKGYTSEQEITKNKNYILDNCLLPLKILDIDGEDEKNIHILSVLDYNENYIFSEYSDYGESFYEKYLELKEEMEYLNQQCYTKEINELLNDVSFQKDFLLILKSEHVKKYLTSVIEFPNDNANDFNVQLHDLSNKSNIDSLFDLELKGDIYLGPQYNSFYNDIEKDFNSLNKLIVLKELGYKIPSCTGPSMRIFINPRLHFSKEAIHDNSQRKSILKSALIILLLHEIAHILKYYPINNIYPKKNPVTPKNKENGKCFMNYLFTKEVITKICYHQSSKINNLNSWNMLNEIRDIFKNEQKSTKILNQEEGELYLYSSDPKNSQIKKTKFEAKTDYCSW